MTATPTGARSIRYRRLSHPLRAAVGWRVGALLLSVLLVVPVAAIATHALSSQENIWPHLVATVLPGYLWRTTILLVGVGALTLVIGVGCAWLITMCRFPGDTILGWALLLPLAMPTYIIAFTYVDVFEYAGPVQTALRQAAGWRRPADYWFPDIRSLGGAIAVLSLVLYPYVYMTARASFLRQSTAQIEVARTLGQNAWGSFLRVALPLARPGIAVGVSLALMECLNDIGAVTFFGVRTLTLGIYNTWIAQGDLSGAAQIALVMFAFVAAMLWLESAGRRRQGFHATTRREPPPARTRLTGWRAAGAALACVAPVGLGFLLPAGVLLDFTGRRLEQLADPGFMKALVNTLLLSGLATVLVVLAGLFLAYARRMARSRIVAVAAGLASLGYALPGTVVGLGLLAPLAGLDHALSALLEQGFGRAPGLILSGTLAAVVIAYLVRFLTISTGTIGSGLERVTPNMDAAARTLGRSGLGALIEVHLPLLRPALLSAALLVFVDCMKELPATLVLRPFDFETLAVRVYTLASLELLGDSAPAALAIVAAGIVPVILLSRGLRSEGR